MGVVHQPVQDRIRQSVVSQARIPFFRRQLAHDHRRGFAVPIILQVDVRKWLASKLAPKKYGDKVLQEVSGASSNVIQVHSTVTFVRPPNWDDDGNVIECD
ncbi:hypothetical protein D3C85_1181780 [compost metagenome]